MPHPSQKKVLEEKDYKRIQEMAGQGLTRKNMAAILDMSTSTFDQRMKEDETAHHALEKGRAQATDKVTKKLFELVLEGKNPALMIFWLKCRANWSELGTFDVEAEEEYPDPISNVIPLGA